MVKRNTRKFRKNKHRNTRKQKGGDVTMITPFLAIVAVCAAVSSSKGLDLDAIAKEGSALGGNLASGVKAQYKNAAAKAKEAGDKATAQMKKQQADIQHQANKAKDKVNAAGAQAAAAAKGG